ncbi:futalosine hydrolase [Daejeonella sp. H1SJ63]|uniref:futalosine hydrolase n=1 Tax=Daejeonella sp. H1SJ63 TaxID=3034145 RepID=UPI0023EB6812|nr:futalosine hydrolase [Daejeonella sp. H1SJ63]
MKILLVAATKAEIEPFLSHFSFSAEVPFEKIFGNYQLNVLITGVGMVATAFSMAKAFSEQSYDLAINAGIAGSFNPSLKPGEICSVSEDIFADLGAEDGDSFLSIETLGFGKSAYSPLKSTSFQIPNAHGLVKAITVNTVHGSEQSIEKIIARLNPDIESMEGAAFFYACEQHQIPSLQIRAISNYVERRNRNNWQIGTAIKELNKYLIQLIES